MNVLHDKKEKKKLLEKHYTIIDELICHLPIAIFSVSFSMILLSLLSYFDVGRNNISGAHNLFHNFHFLHLLFASTGTVLTFRRYSKKIISGLLIGFFIPVIFCTLSDAILPYFAGNIFGINMKFHWCFLIHLDNVIPFVLIGMINGWFMSNHQSNKRLFYSQGFHFLHIFISSMASILYLVSFGFSDWGKHMGYVFIFLILIVLIPCTLSDIVVPIIFTKSKEEKKIKISYGAATYIQAKFKGQERNNKID